MSTVPSWRNGSRFFETDSTYSIFTFVPIAATISLAISTSKPSTSPVVGFFRPKPGWSNFTPTLMVPAFWMRAIVEPVGKVACVVLLPDAAFVDFLSLPHDTSTNASPTTNARTFHRRCFIISWSS